MRVEMRQSCTILVVARPTSHDTNAIARLVTHASIPTVTQMTCARAFIYPRMENLSLPDEPNRMVSGCVNHSSLSSSLSSFLSRSEVSPSQNNNACSCAQVHEVKNGSSCADAPHELQRETRAELGRLARNRIGDSIVVLVSRTRETRTESRRLLIFLYCSP